MVAVVHELRFGEQEYTVNEMKQNIVILNQSDIRNRVQRRH